MMVRLEDRIKELEIAAQDVERLANAKKYSDSEDKVRALASRNALSNATKQLAIAMRHEKMGAIPISARAVFAANVFKHSALSSARSIATEFDYFQTCESDVRGGQRFIDNFRKFFAGTNTTARRITPQPSGPGAGDVSEGAVKPVREYVFTATDYPFSKLAVTDTITSEILLADVAERAADYIVDALVEHVKDRLDQRLINYLLSNASVFNPSLFSNYLNISPGSARWHDLINAMQLQFEKDFADSFLDIKYGNILVAPYEAFFGIIQDRKANGLELYNNIGPFGDLSVDGIWKSSFATNMVLTHTDALTVELVDEVQIFYNRVADSADDRNLYRITAEVYYRFVPSKIPLPAVRTNNPLSNLQALATV